MSDWQDKLSPRAKERLAQIEGEENRKEELYLQSGLTQEAFIQAVRGKVEKERHPFALAVYQIFDEFFKRELKITEVTLACQKGCSICCQRTLLTCTEPEIDTIIRFINGLPLPRRLPLIRKIRQYVREWEIYYRRNRFLLERNPFLAFRDWRKPCVFLNEEGGCEIYPARIMDCRSYTSLIPCTSEMTPLAPCDLRHRGPGRFRFQTEGWANNLILEEEARRLKLAGPQQVQVVVIYHWLLLKKRKWK